MANLRNYIIKEEMLFDDELNPATSAYDIIWPVSVLDAIIDQNTPERKTLRQILGEMNDIFINGPPIIFPVRSVRGEAQTGLEVTPEMIGDVIITRSSMGLGNVDNTSDMDKPVSNPQQDWISQYVTSQLTNYTVNNPIPDTTNYDDHLMDFNNPHHVTLSQLDVSPGGGVPGPITNIINEIIDDHNEANSSAHADIRTEIDNLENLFNNLLASAESLANKVTNFNSSYTNGPSGGVNTNNNYYPTTQAVVSYVENRLNVALNSGTIAPGIVDNAHMADMPSGYIKGRISPGAGSPEDIPIATLISYMSNEMSNQGFGGTNVSNSATPPPITVSSKRYLWIPTVGTYAHIPHYCTGSAWIPIRAAWQ